MYPFLRMAYQVRAFRNAPPLGLFETHESTHLCWPIDLDFYWELNNGRTLTLYDLGRVVLMHRTGVVGAMKQRRWGGTVAGATVRYRKRVRLFDLVTMRSRFVGWDSRFLYNEQSMWRQGECTSHCLYRIAVTTRTGMVPMDEVMEAIGEDESPPLPDWVAAWIAAEAERPWPPMQE